MIDARFRGLRTDGKGWAYGYYSEEFERGYHSQGMDDVPPRCSYILDKKGHSFEVEKESVGQRLDIQDKNKIQAYQGDMVAGRIDRAHIIDVREDYFSSVIEWSKSQCSFFLVNKDSESKEITERRFKRFEIIGNIHEEKDKDYYCAMVSGSNDKPCKNQCGNCNEFEYPDRQYAKKPTS